MSIVFSIVLLRALSDLFMSLLYMSPFASSTMTLYPFAPDNRLAKPQKTLAWVFWISLLTSVIVSAGSPKNGVNSPPSAEGI